MQGYVLHPQVEIHNASDKSGILVFSGFSGTTIRLSEKLSPLVQFLKDNKIVTEASVMSYLDTVDAEQAQSVWQALLLNYILFPEDKL